MPIELITFEEALKLADTKKHVLLGNGFSMALMKDVFGYESLFENADFTAAPHVPDLFKALGSSDFEAVIRLLIDMSKILKAYPGMPVNIIKQIEADAKKIKDVLATSIAKNHPEKPNSIEDFQYVACRLFLSNFERIYSLNYDVLLYWAILHSDVDELNLKQDDGFRHPKGNEDAPYVSWQDGHNSTLYYLHGALHLFDAGHEITKYTWSKTDTPIIEQIRNALDFEKYPIFVAEGHSTAKQTKILHNAYLHKSQRSFSGIRGSLFIFGHSFDDNDDHIIGLIPYGNIKKLFVGLFGDINSDSNKKIISKAKSYVSQRLSIPNKRIQLELHFYNVATANVWG